MSRARLNADHYAGSTDASVLSGVLPIGVTGGSGLTALGTVASGNLSNSDIVYPTGHILRCYSHHDTNNGAYSAAEDPLGGSSGLRCPESGTNITTSVDNSKFYITATVSSSWGGSTSSGYGVMETDFGLYITRNSISGTTTARVGGVANTAARGGSGTWFGTDDAIKGLNPLDSRCFVLQYLDSPSANAGTILYYSIGVAGDLNEPFAYNRCGSNAANGISASTVTVMEIVG